jgi:integrase
MARPATGSIVERRGKDGVTFGLRFRAYGRRQYVTAQGTTRVDAERELRHLLADVERGRWQPPRAEPTVAPAVEPTFREFASEWLAQRESEGLAERTIADLRWSLELHLLPYFASFRLSAITPQEVDRYKVAKVREREAIDAARADAAARGEKLRERGLSNGSVNHTLSDLAQVLETAVEYGLLSQHPASGRRRRLKAARPNRPWVEPEQLPAFLAAAPAGGGRMLLGLLAGTGMRIDEALSLRWRNVDLMGAGTLSIVASKTAAGVRTVDLTAALRDELAAWWRETKHAHPDDYVLPSSTGRKQSPSNVRRDALAPTIERANVDLVKDGIAPIDTTFHGLRRTYASLRCACGDDVAYTASQLGHEDGRFTLRAYAQATKRRERLSGVHLRAYDAAIEWARMGTNGQDEATERVPAMQRTTEKPRRSGAF